MTAIAALRPLTLGIGIALLPAPALAVMIEPIADEVFVVAKAGTVTELSRGHTPTYINSAVERDIFAIDRGARSSAYVRIDWTSPAKAAGQFLLGNDFGSTTGIELSAFAGHYYSGIVSEGATLRFRYSTFNGPFSFDLNGDNRQLEGDKTIFVDVAPGLFRLIVERSHTTAGFAGFGFDFDFLARQSPPIPNQPVPEPASWVMMIAGFGIVGAALRRRAQPGAMRGAIRGG